LGKIEVVETKENPIQEKKTQTNETTSSLTETVADKITPEEITKPIIENNTSKISAFSLSSIKAKKQLEAEKKNFKSKEIVYPTEPFSETDMLLQWNKFALKLESRGNMILHSLMLINVPILRGFTIEHELPNEGTKIEFERALNEILGYLRGMLHNHDITIVLKVNELIESKRAFTAEDKFNRLNALNPNLELLRKSFDLDI